MLDKFTLFCQKYAIAGLAILLAVALLFGGWEKLRADHQTHRAEAAEQRARAAEAQAALNLKAATIADTAQTRIVTVKERAHAAAAEIRADRSGSAVLPDSVAASWRAGVVGLRSPSGDNPDSREPAPAVQGAADPE